MIYSCNYPVLHTFDITGTYEFIDYTVTYNGKQRYYGRIHPFDDSGTVEIDISEICRAFLEPLYENNLQWATATDCSPVPFTDTHTTIGVFTVSSENNPSGDASYTVMYNYNTDFISTYPDTYALNTPLTQAVDPRQRLFSSGYSNAPINFAFAINGNQADTKTITTAVFANYGVNLREFLLAKGDTLTLTGAGGTQHNYTVTAPCHNRFALYYVNKLGGLDSMLFTGRAIENLNASDTDVSLFNNRANRTDWEQKRIYREIEKTYQLNTGYIISQTASRNIGELFNAVKVWLHDLEQDTINACLITNSGVQIAEKRYDGLVNYTITVKQSQLQIRR